MFSPKLLVDTGGNFCHAYQTQCRPQIRHCAHSSSKNKKTQHSRLFQSIYALRCLPIKGFGFYSGQRSAMKAGAAHEVALVFAGFDRIQNNTRFRVYVVVVVISFDDLLLIVDDEMHIKNFLILL
jgi:hypothetical protein